MGVLDLASWAGRSGLWGCGIRYGLWVGASCWFTSIALAVVVLWKSPSLPGSPMGEMPVLGVKVSA